MANDAYSYLPSNVYEQTIKRINWLYDEFGKVVVSSSGGKDSTIVLECVLEVAAERGIEKVPVCWLDQECEYEATVAYMTDVMTRPNVEPYWMQVPFRMFNATSTTDQWLNVWGEGEEWVREQHPLSMKDNIYGTDRFKKLLIAIQDYHHAGYAVVTGVRAEESPARRAMLTTHPCYKWVTWGTKQPQHHLFHPIYDWSWRDVWKTIFDKGWKYNEHYDHQYRYGFHVHNMRVSNYHHETAIGHLFSLQEIEPDTYAKATSRLSGISTTAHLGKADFFVKELPFMFSSWAEYRDYLVENILPPERQTAFKKMFVTVDKEFAILLDEPKVFLDIMKTEVNSILVNDFDFVKIENMRLRLRRLKKDKQKGVVYVPRRK